MRRTNLLKTIPLDQLMDLKIDFAFKQLFGIEKNKKITIAFLNAILKRTNRDWINDISFGNTEVGGEYENDKYSRLDILAATQSGEWINIEIQFANQYDMVKRTLYYWSGLYRTPIEKSMSYKELHPVIAINIMNFELLYETELFHTTYHLYEDKEKFQLTDVMEFHFIEMPKLIRDWQVGKLDPWNDLLARWLLLLGMVDRRKGKVYEDIFKELEEIAMKDETLKEAFQCWEALSGTMEQRIAYEGRMKRIFDEQSAIREAELRNQEMEKCSKEMEKRSKEMEKRELKIEKEEQRIEKEEQRIKKEEQRIKTEEQKIKKVEQRIEKEQQKIEKGWQEIEYDKQEIERQEQRKKKEMVRRLFNKGMNLEAIAEVLELSEKSVEEIIGPSH